jgi:hypothetical protein
MHKTAITIHAIRNAGCTTEGVCGMYYRGTARDVLQRDCAGCTTEGLRGIYYRGTVRFVSSYSKLNVRGTEHFWLSAPVFPNVKFLNTFQKSQGSLTHTL